MEYWNFHATKKYYFKIKFSNIFSQIIGFRRNRALLPMSSSLFVCAFSSTHRAAQWWELLPRRRTRPWPRLRYPPRPFPPSHPPTHSTHLLSRRHCQARRLLSPETPEIDRPSMERPTSIRQVLGRNLKTKKINNEILNIFFLNM